MTPAFNCALGGCLGAGFALLVAVVWRPALGNHYVTSASVPFAPIAPSEATSSRTVELATWARRAPFRRTRVPARVRFDPRRSESASVARPPVPRPVLVLRGMVVGAEPAAVVEGLPGIEGTRAVRVGDRIGDLTVRRITRDEVVIRASDTTWMLRLPPAQGPQ